MLRIKSTQNATFTQKNGKTKNNKLSFGMNPISKTKNKITSTLRPIASDVYQISNSIASSNIQQNLQQQNLNYNSNNIEPLEIIIGSQQNDSLNAISTTPIQNNLDLTYDEFYEKDMEADKYFNNKCNTFSKALSLIPVIGVLGAIGTLSANTRNQELDEIYGVPEYIPVNEDIYSKYNLFAIAVAQASVYGSILAIPLAIINLFFIQKQNENLKNAYHKAYKEEQKQVKNETPDETIKRHTKLKEIYEKSKEDAKIIASLYG